MFRMGHPYGQLERASLRFSSFVTAVAIADRQVRPKLVEFGTRLNVGADVWESRARPHGLVRGHRTSLPMEACRT